MVVLYVCIAATKASRKNRCNYIHPSKDIFFSLITGKRMTCHIIDVSTKDNAFYFVFRPSFILNRCKGQKFICFFFIIDNLFIEFPIIYRNNA